MTLLLYIPDARLHAAWLLRGATATLLRGRNGFGQAVLAFSRCGRESGTRAFAIFGIAILAELVATVQAEPL